MERDFHPLKAEKLRLAIRRALSAGHQLGPDAVKVLEEALDPERVIEIAVRKFKEPSVLSGDLLKSVVQELEQLTPKTTFRAYASEIEEEVEVVMDPTTRLNTESSELGFLRYFRSRLEKLGSILRERMDAMNALSISEALRRPLGSTVKLIGLVLDKIERRGRIRILLDDFDEVTTVVFDSGVGSGYEKAQQLLVDQVVCVQATRYPTHFLATDVLWPDVPLKAKRREVAIKGHVYAVLTSDLHVGSKQFLEKAFERFIRWLRGECGSALERRIAEGAKYLIIAGELVDGLGVYPGQEEDLLITNVEEQYEYAARLLEEIPEYIRVIIIPGNHDAVRQALPQPAVPRKYARQLYSNSSVMMLGNPSCIKLHGTVLWLYHGQSLEDVIGSVRGLSYSRPQDAMCMLLRARHLAPIYGANTPIAPEPEDLLVIEEIPDVLHCGHVHVYGCRTYRDVVVVNSGAWQAITSYQLKRGITPTPGIVPVLNIQTLEIVEVDFGSNLAV